jgi:hypothetical protein
VHHGAGRDASRRDAAGVGEEGSLHNLPPRLGPRTRGACLLHLPVPVRQHVRGMLFAECGIRFQGPHLYTVTVSRVCISTSTSLCSSSNVQHPCLGGEGALRSNKALYIRVLKPASKNLNYHVVQSLFLHAPVASQP